ncbi:hypothetical protein AUJ66_07500 [Candidatus Desantisbacteria bacterium CG1_02_38_46]|uniref:AbrB family transcriptional regulator n=3 Tax=unclassified Candidatus Desantisiibacteriota TaxID=3106372 RepID=A0A2H9PAU0_9BACT|nr:MAG: hypothetical protein AUJ66_07500 [Candidatus Desantisbacteria bacterium CG1_02_38_46]PIU52209.1 MAG: AbrB family transcriptional regulator [Candidatus Desantisbacteria bacterium CG07_land_8_20_14_0_80_39_15]PIZ14908.1 MAG: AbrB family transcriptional regulator [Candidatus Desantisbacteria bacterium CG_4_10_14_0_8_um_filter_39_17]
MAEATITSKGQVTIPKSVREILELKPHDRVVFIPYGDHVIIRPLKGTILDIRGSVKHEGGLINFKKMREEMKEEVAKGIVKEMGDFL